MVCPAGFEPATHSLEGCCSIRLSYGQEIERMKDEGGRMNDGVGAFHPSAFIPAKKIGVGSGI